METYILRHGIADEPKPGADDAGRALTQEGKKRLREVLRLARRASVAPAQILTSPYRRAVETAEIAAHELGHKEPLVKTRVLQPGSSPETVWSELRDHAKAGSVMVVGHEPLLGYLAGYLLGVPALRIDMKKGALVRIDVEQTGPAPRGELKWMLTPKLASAKG